MISRQTPAQLAQHKGVRQFIKFVIVGASSTAINFAVLNLVLYLFPLAKYTAATMGFLFSVYNGYFWNKRWTFKGATEKSASKQFAQFVLVNLVGLTLDLLIIRLISAPLEHDFHLTLRLATNIAALGATAVVVFWNYFANRMWTFKP